MKKVSILDRISLPDEAIFELRSLSSIPLKVPDSTMDPLPVLKDRTGDASIVLVSPFTRLEAAYFESCPTVKHVALCGTSMGNIDLKAASDYGVTVSNVKHYGDSSAAEFFFMQLISVARGVGTYQWKEQPCELMGKKVGIIGLGSLGQAIAHLALGFGMQVMYTGPTRKPEWESKGVAYLPLEKLFTSSDIIILSVPTNTLVLTNETFEQIPDGRIIVQCSIGQIMDSVGFRKWIARDGNLAIFDYSAGDALYQEYKDIPRVVFPKIIAGLSFETKIRLGQGVIKNVHAISMTRSS